MSRTLRTPDQRAAALARRQHGALAHAQAVGCGLTTRMIGQRVRSGGWRRIAPGVSIVGGAPDTHKQRAMIACLATNGVASHQTAAALFGLVPFPVLPHVTVAFGRSTRCRQARVHRSVLDPKDRCVVDGIPCTTPARALVELATSLATADLGDLVDDAIDRGLVTAPRVRIALERAGSHHRGKATLLAALAPWEGPIKPGSPAEARLVRLLQAWGYDGFVLQHEVFGENGDFVARLDVAWPHRKAALEYEGVRHHGPRATPKDEGRYARLKALGWCVDGVDNVDVLPGERRLRDLLDSWLRAERLPPRAERPRRSTSAR